MFEYQKDMFVKNICVRCDRYHHIGTPPCFEKCPFIKLIGEHYEQEQKKKSNS